MEDKKLFAIALRYINRGYSGENLIWDDDLYEASQEDIDKCSQYYSNIREQGTNWANEHLKTL